MDSTSLFVFLGTFVLMLLTIVSLVAAVRKKDSVYWMASFMLIVALMSGVCLCCMVGTKAYTIPAKPAVEQVDSLSAAPSDSLIIDNIEVE